MVWYGMVEVCVGAPVAVSGCVIVYGTQNSAQFRRQPVNLLTNLMDQRFMVTREPVEKYK
jgi:hypothetical protein